MRHSITPSDVFRPHQHEAIPAPPPVMACLWSRTSMLKEIWDVVQGAEAWPGVAVAPDRNGLRLMLGDAVLGHLRSNGRIDLPFRPEIRDRLVAEELASRDPDHPDASRIVFVVRTLADVDHAVWLVRLAYLSVRAPANDVVQSRGNRFPAHGDL